jgi:hypothetical protein
MERSPAKFHVLQNVEILTLYNVSSLHSLAAVYSIKYMQLSIIQHVWWMACAGHMTRSYRNLIQTQDNKFSLFSFGVEVFLGDIAKDFGYINCNENTNTSSSLYCNGT